MLSLPSCDFVSFTRIGCCVVHGLYSPETHPSRAGDSIRVLLCVTEIVRNGNINSSIQPGNGWMTVSYINRVMSMQYSLLSFLPMVGNCVTFAYILCHVNPSDTLFRRVGESTLFVGGSAKSTRPGNDNSIMSLAQQKRFLSP